MRSGKFDVVVLVSVFLLLCLGSGFQIQSQQIATSDEVQKTKILPGNIYPVTLKILKKRQTDSSSTQCTIFAATEIISYLKHLESIENLAAGIHYSLARKSNSDGKGEMYN